MRLTRIISSLGVFGCAMIMAACSGGGESSSVAAGAPVPDRLSPKSNSELTTMRGATDLQGTWLVYKMGTYSRGNGPRDASDSYIEDFEINSRSTLRIAENGEGRLVLYTCDMGGAATTERAANASSLTVSWYENSTTFFLGIPMEVESNVQMRSQAVQRDYSFQNGDRYVGWDVQWIAQRLSDDPFEPVAAIDNAADSMIRTTGCVHEMRARLTTTEGNSGPLHEALAYSESELSDGSVSGSALFRMGRFSDFGSFFSDPSGFYSSNRGDTVNIEISDGDLETLYEVEARHRFESTQQSNTVLEVFN